jgi:hypothetical protein
VGAFPDGPDSLLFNPDISARRWRRERLRAAARPSIVAEGLAGAILVVVGVCVASGAAAVLMSGVGVLAVVVSALGGWAGAAGVLTEHHHDTGRPCRLERTRGAFFFRTHDFRDLGPAGYGAVRALIAGVHELHRTPARTWIDPALPGQAHRVAWQALCCLDRTRDAHALAAELATKPDRDVDADAEVSGMATAARQAVAATEDGLAEVMAQLEGCLALTRAWERKLRRADLAARTEHTLAALTDHGGIQRQVDTAHTLPQTVFAYITAARDITGAGPFPWEHQPPPQCPASRIHRHPNPNGASPTTTHPPHTRPGDPS